MTKLLLIATIALAGCYDSTGPYAPPLPPPGIVGNWTATAFTTTTAGGTIDRFAQGARVNLTLRADFTTSGVVTAEGATVAFAGTWDTTQAVLRLHPENPIFLDRLPFQVQPNELVGDALIGVTDFHVVLRRP